MSWADAEHEFANGEYEELWDTAEVCAFLGISRQRVHQLRTRHADPLPAPALERPAWYLWRRHDIERWTRTTNYFERNTGWDTKAVASHLGVSRQHVRAMSHDRRLNFPRPTSQSPARFSWDPERIKNWAQDHGYPKQPT